MEYTVFGFDYYYGSISKIYVKIHGTPDKSYTLAKSIITLVLYVGYHVFPSVFSSNALVCTINALVSS